MAPKSEQTGRFKRGTGPVLSKVRAHLIFWGARWDGSVEKTRITEAAEIMVKPGGYLAQLTEYTDDHTIDVVVNPVTAGPPKPLAGPLDIQAEVSRLIGAGTVPHPDPSLDTGKRNQLYVLILPHGVKTNETGEEGLGGRHSSFPFEDKPAYYAWVRSTLVGDPVPRITVALSEELVEAITDPEPFTGWVSADKQEVCDVCEGVNWRLHGKPGVLVRTYYSNALQDCFPGPPVKDAE
jgi:hypothetical protein